MLREGQKIRGLTDTTMPRRLGPKPATNIRKLYNLAKFVVKYPLPEEDGKKAKSKTPKIQRVITLVVLQGKRHRLVKKKRCVTTEYMKVLALRRRSVSAAGPDCLRCVNRSTHWDPRRRRTRLIEAAKKRDEAKTVRMSEAGKKAVAEEKNIVKKDGADRLWQRGQEGGETEEVKR
ncbi:40S ribosomal protein S6-like [Culex pipiens pallens]|uniref:40S ribosomal protein S6-like n=1 Tax=Culex pipiens pallens TaxID=42434 RepID=UPI001954E5E3|nr:40S ribosomal protein S6-like [Culex pipiens pallens]